MLNDEAQTAVHPELLERAFEKSVVRGEPVFYELVRRESKLVGEWECVQGFKRTEVLDAPADTAILRSLQRRELVVPVDGGGWRLRVPLMRRWLIERG